ncbi:MAG TPA: DsrE family protein [Conexivisphaerales archaeon]|nr:DsrE family protein [Conexivisphaerales archaeon]
MPREILVIFMRSPVSSAYFVEGLRVSAGMLSGDEDHRVTVAFIGKGARCAVKGVDRMYATKFLEFFPEQNGKKFLVEEESLRDQGIDQSTLAPDFAVAKRADISRKMLEADLCLSF